MKFICETNQRESAILAAKIVADLIREKPDATLGLATGSSPVDVYHELVKMYRNKEVSFHKIKTLNLDEYVSLSADHEQSYAYFMRKHLFDKIDIQKENTHIPNGVAPDLREECLRYDGIIESVGRVDLQILGIGHNGHIAFNEPSDSFSTSTSLVSLTPSTVKANSRFFKPHESPPTWAITMGIGSILKAKRIILLAFGEGKARALERALFGPITPTLPASALQLYSGELTVCTDPAAFSEIKNKIKKGLSH